MTKHNMRIFGVSPMFKLRNNTQTTVIPWNILVCDVFSTFANTIKPALFIRWPIKTAEHKTAALMVVFLAAWFSGCLLTFDWKYKRVSEWVSKCLVPNSSCCLCGRKATLKKWVSGIYSFPFFYPVIHVLLEFWLKWPYWPLSWNPGTWWETKWKASPQKRCMPDVSEWDLAVWNVRLGNFVALCAKLCLTVYRYAKYNQLILLSIIKSCVASLNNR